jgi:hypothetical protein
MALAGFMGEVAICGSIASVAAIGMIVGVVVAGMLMWLVPIKEASWVEDTFYSHKKPIPDYAIQTAIDIKKLCPEANLRLECLRIDQKPSPDPFLVWELPGALKGREVLYLEVWEEPSFRGKRIEVKDAIK